MQGTCLSLFFSFKNSASNILDTNWFSCFPGSIWFIHDLYYQPEKLYHFSRFFLILLIFPLKTDSFTVSELFFFLVDVVLNCCNLSGVSINDTLQLKNTSFLSLSFAWNCMFLVPKPLGKRRKNATFNNAFQI
jgi:hypothetical protein